MAHLVWAIQVTRILWRNAGGVTWVARIRGP